MEVSVQAVVEEAIRYEHNLAALYLLLSSSIPDDSEFWWELSVSEERHAALLVASQRLFGEEFARETLPADLELLRSSNQSLEANIDRFKENAPQLEEALRIALALEGNENEATLYRLLEVDSSKPAKEVVDHIQREDASHAQKIREYASRKGFSL